jgi:hypothetical protein
MVEHARHDPVGGVGAARPAATIAPVDIGTLVIVDRGHRVSGITGAGCQCHRPALASATLLLPKALTTWDSAALESSWGVEAAPLDGSEWDAKRYIYHTATTGPLLDQDGLAVAAADITPAYTNPRSGDGTFSTRMRRVERLWRIFGHDRIDDVLVVFDQVTATRGSFRSAGSCTPSKQRPNLWTVPALPSRQKTAGDTGAAA